MSRRQILSEWRSTSTASEVRTQLDSAFPLAYFMNLRMSFHLLANNNYHNRSWTPSVWIISFNATTLWGRSYYHLHFTDKEPEADGRLMACSKYTGSRKLEVSKAKKSGFKADTVNYLKHCLPRGVGGWARMHGCKQQQQHWLIQAEKELIKEHWWLVELPGELENQALGNISKYITPSLAF